MSTVFTNSEFLKEPLCLPNFIFRHKCCKVNLIEDHIINADGSSTEVLFDEQYLDYIYCLRYNDSDVVRTNFQPLEVTDTTISCNLNQRQRSSQQILDLADYLQIHQSDYPPIRQWNSGKSFSSDIPLWVELSNRKLFLDYFKDKFKSGDVMLIYKNPSDLNGIEEFFVDQKWRCTHMGNVRGSEASVTILYDLNDFYYEDLTRAKKQLVIVTIDGKSRYLPYFLLFQKWFISFPKLNSPF